MELRDCLRILHKHWISIVAITLIGVLAAAGLSMLSTPKYDATTQIYVSVGAAARLGDIRHG